MEKKAFITLHLLVLVATKQQEPSYTTNNNAEYKDYDYDYEDEYSGDDYKYGEYEDYDGDDYTYPVIQEPIDGQHINDLIKEFPPQPIGPRISPAEIGEFDTQYGTYIGEFSVSISLPINKD